MKNVKNDANEHYSNLCLCLHMHAPLCVVFLFFSSYSDACHWIQKLTLIQNDFISQFLLSWHPQRLFSKWITFTKFQLDIPLGRRGASINKRLSGLPRSFACLTSCQVMLMLLVWETLIEGPLPSAKTPHPSDSLFWYLTSVRCLHWKEQRKMAKTRPHLSPCLPHQSLSAFPVTPN